jgi:hypothetical protein
LSRAQVSERRQTNATLSALAVAMPAAALSATAMSAAP